VQVSVPDDFKHHTGQWGEGVNWGEMRLAVYLRDLKKVFIARSYARGWPEQPAVWSDVVEKYRECCNGILRPAQTEDSIAAIRSLDTLKEVRRLLSMLRP